MSHYPPSVLNLIRQLSKLPGIGEKSAERLVMHLLQRPRGDAEKLAHSILEMKDRLRVCASCFALSDSEICAICADPARDPHTLCVVEQPADMVAVERTGAFHGCYHVLQGALAPMEGIGPDQIRIKELLARIADGKIREIIIATGTSVEGEATASYLAERLKSRSVAVTRIASGVPMGGDLKFIDQVTLKKAMDSRHAI